jgi:tetratricopeptide (TPR) repeat protein
MTWNQDRLYMKALTMFEEGKTQKAADILQGLADAGHMDAIEQLVYIFLDQRDFDEVERLLMLAEDQADSVVLYLRARLLEEQELLDAAEEAFRLAAQHGSPNAHSALILMNLERGDVEAARHWVAEGRKVEGWAERGLEGRLEEFESQIAELTAEVSGGASSRRTQSTGFDKRCEILSEMWSNYRHDEVFDDFFEYNDLGLPLAHQAHVGLAKPSAEGRQHINETFDLLLESLGKEDVGWGSLDELLGLVHDDDDRVIDEVQVTELEVAVVANEPAAGMDIARVDIQQFATGSHYLESSQDTQQNDDFQLLLRLSTTDDLELLEQHAADHHERDSRIVALRNPAISIVRAAQFEMQHFTWSLQRILSSVAEHELPDSIWSGDFSDVPQQVRLEIGADDGEETDFEESDLDPDDVGEYLRKCFALWRRNSAGDRSLIEEQDPDTHRWLTALDSHQLLRAYEYWRLDAWDDFAFSQDSFRAETHPNVLGDELFSGLGWVDRFYIPSEVQAEEESPFWFNVECGEASISNSLETSGAAAGLALLSGAGDGIYGVFPVFERSGDLAMILATFYDLRLGSPLNESHWGASSPGHTLPHFDRHIPVPLGHVQSHGSLYFQDAGWMDEGSREGDRVVQFTGLPQESVLVIGMVNCSLDVIETYGWRTWAIATVRGDAKRDLEILFSMFPELQALGNEMRDTATRQWPS